VKRRARKVALVLIAWIYVLPVLALLLYAFGSLSSLFVFNDSISWADYMFHYPIWIALIIVLELTAPFLVLDITLLVARLFLSSLQKFRRAFAYVRLVLGTLAILYVPIRTTIDTAHVRDSTLRIPIAALPQELDGLQLSLLGDMQIDRYTGDSKISQVRGIIESRKPGMLLSAGDMVTSGTTFLGEAAAAIQHLKGTHGNVAVMGDHDFWSAPEAVRAMYLSDGWTFLDNEHCLSSFAGRSVLVTGLTHIYSNRLKVTDLKSFLDSAPKADLRILLVHQPAEQVVRLAADAGYHLVLAGHTHGGQIVLHPLGIALTPSMLETKYYEGAYKVGSTTVVVTRGVGVTLAPVRYHSGAEVTTLVLAKN